MSQNKVLYLTNAEGNLAIQEVNIPKPGPGQLLVKLESAALNPLDWKRIKFGLYITGYPTVLGLEGAGTVEAVGPDVTTSSKGDKVLLQCNFDNASAGFQQYVLAPADLVGKVSPTISMDEAASIPIAAATAAVGLYSDRQETGAMQYSVPWEEGGAGLYSGKPIVIFGGSSSVGQFAIQFAKLSGFSPIITTASLKNAELVKSIGATHVIDRNSDIVSEVRKITSEPVELVFDAIAQDGTQEQGWEIVATGGSLAVTLPPSVDTKKYADKHIVHIYAHFGVHKALGTSFYKNLPRLLENGLLKTNRVEVVKGGLSGVADGLKLLEENKVSGHKLIIHPHETS